MPADFSFDVVSEVDRQEVDNALNQARKEIAQRFDFKGTGAEIGWAGDLAVTVKANADQRAKAALEVFKEKCVRRNVPIKALQVGDPKQVGGGAFQIDITINQGIADEKAREMVKELKRSGLKVQAAIQKDQVRVSSKSKDALQGAIKLLKDRDYGIPLQFTNYR
jgi:uncharacterized protein YajQ (UPF0234 family)